ncbi:formiminoglutamase [Ekhidna lutea]|uniref:Formiminoglutamase n=1 Tax=Ekhidna lutea TaxID=447679 RepID=A0A239KLT2_EKHLU|nr:formimidoylglutamase [Ekhidna lutea]SNT18573.1 formiminoglutamase [Ekhidna lutea]
MDLKLFFNPVEIDVDKSPASFQSSIYINRDKMPDHEGMDIALIGLNEYRGLDEKADQESANKVRNQLYKLKKGYGDYGIVDLGNFRNGPTLEDTYLRLKEVCAYLMETNIIPVLFGGSHDLDLGQYYAYENSEKLVSVLNIDNQMDFDDETNASFNHIGSIFKHSPNYLFSYYHLAYQSYLTHQKSIELLEKLSFESVRLGIVKENIKDIEPIVRDADMLSFDLCALQAFYAPGAINSKVYGLTGEEACQLCWYAGQNEKMSSVGLYNYDASKDSEDQKTAFVLSTMIWYFIEGYYHRKGDKNFKSNDYLMYEVHLGGEPDTIRFYKSKLSERWWMEVPNPESEGLFNRNRMIACNHSDYELAMKGEIPDRWMNFYNKV